MTLPLRMFELLMVAFTAHLYPAIGFQFFDELLTIHALKNTHEYTLMQVDCGKFGGANYGVKISRNHGIRREN